MKLGMLWFDNDPRKSLAEKVISASKYYNAKYKLVPNLCFVHPAMLAASTDPPDHVDVILDEYQYRIDLLTSRSILPNHLWIGRNNGEIDLYSADFSQISA